MKKIYLKPALENIVVTPLCAIQAASASYNLNASDYNATDIVADKNDEALSKNAKGFDLWD